MSKSKSKSQQKRASQATRVNQQIPTASIAKTSDLCGHSDKFGNSKIANDIATSIHDVGKQEWQEGTRRKHKAVKKHIDAGGELSDVWPFVFRKEVCEGTYEAWKQEKHKFPVFNPAKELDTLYTILAFCHDDFFPQDPIVTDEIRALCPELYTCTKLCVNAFPHFNQELEDYLKYVRKDLEDKKKPRQTSTAGEESMRVPWDDKDPNYMKLSEALVLFTGSRIALSTLGRKVKRDGQVHFMRYGQRCNVHIGEFRVWVKIKHPQLSITPEAWDEIQADMSARIRQEKKRRERAQR